MFDFNSKKNEWKEVPNCKCDKVFLDHLRFSMPAAEKSDSQGKEKYKKDFDTNMCIYENKLYYIGRGFLYKDLFFLCCSNMDGSNIRILRKIDNDYRYAKIAVNSTGIYIYTLYCSYSLFVIHMSFEGEIISECRTNYGEEEEEYIKSDIYVCGNKVFFVDNYDSEIKMNPQIKCMYVDDNRVETIYCKASFITRLFATNNQIIFQARYENEDADLSADGWMIMNMIDYSMECLSNPYCNIENVVDQPDVYDEDSMQYNRYCNYSMRISFFDLDRGIFWTDRKAVEKTDLGKEIRVYYREPRALWGNREKVIANLPVWRIDDDHWGQEYFDGTYRFKAECYYKFESCTRDGEKYEWSVGNGMHGMCDSFKVLGDYLFLDVAGIQEEQYNLSTEIVSPIRKSWIENKLSLDLVKDYMNKDFEKTDFLQCIENNCSRDEASKLNTNLEIEKVIGNTDIKYNICTFGSKFHIGFGVPVKIVIGNNVYNCKTHNSAKGRIDGMKKLFLENSICLGDRLHATYSDEENTIYLEKLIV